MALTSDNLAVLFNGVFGFQTGEKMAFITDLPCGRHTDNPDWAWLRQTAARWRSDMPRNGRGRPCRADLLIYPATGNTNLPKFMAVWNATNDPQRLKGLGWKPTRDILGEYQVVVAMTHFSVTRQLKALAKELGFRCATMPGFTDKMMPALFIDDTKVERRTMVLYELLRQAERAEVWFKTGGNVYSLTLDLRFNEAQASTGRYPNPGDGGNLPSGEAYIAPYVGRRHPEIPSITSGLWPVQYPNGVVVFRVEAGRLIGTHADDKASHEVWQTFAVEPGLCWLAELGLGVLADLGIKAVGDVLLDEKLGLHIAFGESASGGEITADDFVDQARVDHNDIVYVPSLQPDIVVQRMFLNLADDSVREIIKDGNYVRGLFG